MTDKRFWFIAFLVLIFGAMARFINLGQVPQALYWDEQAILLDSWSVAQTGTDWHGQSWWQAIFASYGDFKLPVYIWASSLVVKMFGAGAWAVRLPSALAGILSILLSGLLVKDLVKLFKIKLDNLQLKVVILSTLIISATSYWGIHFSHVGFEGHLGQLLMGLAIWLLVKSWLILNTSQDKRKSLLYIILACIIGSLSIFCYYSVRFVLPPLILLLTLTACWSYKKNFKAFLIKPILVLIVVVVSILIFNNSPLADANDQIRLSTDSLLSTDRHILEANQAQAEFDRSLVSRVLYHRESFRATHLLENVFAHSSLDYLYLSGDINLRHGTGEQGLFSLLLLPIGLMGIWYLAKSNWKLLVLLLGWWGVGVLPASIPTSVPHALRSLNAFLPLVLIHGFGLFMLWQVSRKWVFNTVILLLILVTTIFVWEYQTQYKLDSARSFQAGYKEVASYVKSNQPKFSQIWVAPFDGRWFLWLLSAQDTPPTQLLELVRDDYAVSRVKNVQLQTPDCNELHLDNQLVVGEQAVVDKIIDICNLTNLQYKIVTATTQTPVVSITKRIVQDDK
jgi:4-amino-4-deoxy-L-arabinose transferase-like glycosyltransferase